SCVAFNGEKWNIQLSAGFKWKLLSSFNNQKRITNFLKRELRTVVRISDPVSKQIKVISFLIIYESIPQPIIIVRFGGRCLRCKISSKFTTFLVHEKVDVFRIRLFSFQNSH